MPEPPEINGLNPPTLPSSFVPHGRGNESGNEQRLSKYKCVAVSCRKHISIALLCLKRCIAKLPLRVGLKCAS